MGERFEEVLVDDRFPTFPSGAAPVCASSPFPLFARVAPCVLPDPLALVEAPSLEMWPLVLEKAWAKVFGGYGALEGGGVVSALSALAEKTSIIQQIAQKIRRKKPK